MDEIYLTDLIDRDTLQMLQDGFSKMTGMAALTTDNNGKPVTKGSNFTDFCMNLVRKSEKGSRHCEACDKKGAYLSQENGKICSYRCHCGLMDFAAPILADGKVVGSFVGGQVLPEPPDEEAFRRRAVELDIDPDEMIEALRKVKIMDMETIMKAAEYLGTVASVMSRNAMHQQDAIHLSKELEHAARLKSDFLANMSHEIRTPMNAVIGMAEMALREDISDAAREYILQIKASGKTLLTIINDILDFSKIESGKMEITPVDYEVMSIVNDIVNIIQTRIGEKDIELVVRVDPNLPYMLYGDDIRIKQMITNLANNAVKFTKSGCVSLEITYEEIDGENIWLDVSVRDTGIGIKEEDMNKLFESFQQVDSKRNRNIEGTGLGLAITQQLACLMDGGIDVQSVYGKGSLFHFRIPQKIVDSRSPAPVREKERIFAVGIFQNEYIERSWRFCLELYGIRWEYAKNIEELQKWKEEGANYVFIEYNCINTKFKEFARKNPDITCAALIDPFLKVENLDSFICMKKPIYCMNLAAVFNGESMLHSQMMDGDDEISFRAPDAKILIVDDNAINLTVAEGLLKPLNMQVDTASSGKQSISMVLEKDYDIVFMDHMMPEMDGVETTQYIREMGGKYKEIPIIALTANALSGAREMFLKCGMNDFVPKPIEIRTITAKLKQWLPPEKIQPLTEEEKQAEKEEEFDLVLEGIDTKLGLSFSGTEEIYRKVLRDYYVVIHQKADLISEYEKEEKIKEYTIEVHALKSASRLIGAMELASLAEQLENAGHEENIEMIHEKTDGMLFMYLHYLDVLKDFAPQDEEMEACGEAEISGEEFENICGQLAEAADMLDLEQMEELLEQLKTYYFDEEECNCLKRAVEAVENIDSDSLLEILEEWKRIRAGA